MNRLLQMVEEAGGLPVILVQQDDLEELATVRLATQEQQTHRIIYRDAGAPSSYHVAFEAALLLRMVLVPADQRVILHETREAREKVISQVERMFKGRISLAQARSAGLQYYDGVLMRLRSTGPGLWADRWLYEQAPELRGLQAELLQSQVQENLICLEGQVERLTPTAVLQVTRAINAANTFHSAGLLGIPSLAIPYQAAGLAALAKELISLTSAAPRTNDPDREIVDGWAEKLGISRWYCWKAP
ncbi:MAG: hypothetical protein HQ469_02470 [Cyanobacteria bacterium]|nr:hypothetical protein [Cyanobacteria bacterium bin.275]